MKVILSISFLLLLLIGSCSEAPNFDDTPYLEFVGIADNELRQSSSRDTLVITLYFEDGDGDIGSDIPTDQHIFLTDSRDGQTAFTFNIPKVPEQGAGNGVKGDIILRAVVNKGDVCCLYDTGQAPCTESLDGSNDEYSYEAYLVDRAGNESNRVIIGPIVIICDDPG